MALSTNKAANPISLYGATKLCSDKLFIAANVYSGQHRTKFSVVRYGSVVGSRGSVIPLFLKMKDGGRLPITDPRMTRFWITLERAVSLVISGLEKMHGGEILDLARAIGPNCTYGEVGTRPGEKLHEVLVAVDEEFYVIQPDFPHFRAEAVNWKQAKPVSDGFVYAGDSNTQWLTEEQLHKLVSELNGEIRSENGW